MDYFQTASQLLLYHPDIRLVVADSKDSGLLDLQAIPAYVAAVSALILLLHAVADSKPFYKLRTRLLASQGQQFDDPHSHGVGSPSLLNNPKAFVILHGGCTEFIYKVASFIGCSVLFALSLVNVIMDKEDGGQKGMATQTIGLSGSAYISLLSFISLFIPRSSKVVSRHLIILLLVVLGIFAYRDLWPLLTFTHIPLDIHEGWLLWVKISILTLITIVLPIIKPRQYVPFDPKDPADEPHPEQTASWLSRILFSWIDSTVYLASKVSHLSHEQLPPLADYDRAKNLVQESFPFLDPFSQRKKKGHIFFGFVRIYRGEYIIMASTVIIEVIATLVSPIAVNRLLSYLESGGEGAVVRPWVWICLLFLGPLVTSLAMDWYLYISTQTLVRTEGILTQLIFEHALRIRMKAETPSDIKQTMEANEVLTPDTVESSTNEGESVDGDDTSQTSSTIAESSSQKGKQKTEDVQNENGQEAHNPTSKADNLVGKINNLVTSDLNNITNGRDWLYIVINIPLGVSLCIWLLYSILGWSSFVGLGVMILLFPLPGYMARLIQHVQQQKMHKTDARVQTVTETMNVLRMIKLFGWEQQTNEKITRTREEELLWTWRSKLLELSINITNFIIPIAVMLTTFASYTLLMKQNLSAAVVFSSITVFDVFHRQLHLILGLLPRITQAKVSLDRVDDFLLNSELLDSFHAHYHGASLFKQADEELDVIGFKDAVFTWSENRNGSLTPSKRNFSLKIEDELFFHRGRVNLIVGPTGSGKTSMLMALLGEMHFIPSGPASFFGLPRKGGVAYAAQESWVQNETIQANILFGASYDKERYNKVVYQCGLERDFELFEAGDQTEVGEKGITLSGGQKARITLARAIYSFAEVLLLDDVLAALDVHTSKWIIDKCLGGDLIEGRTVIFVTHNVTMANKVAHFVVSIGSNGRVLSQGSISDVVAHDDKLAAEVLKDNEEEQKVSDTEEEAVQRKQDGKLILAEEIAEGRVGRSAFKLYLAGMGGDYPALFWIVFLVTMTSTQFSENAQPWFLGYWASQYDSHQPSEVHVPYYLGVYGLILLATTTLYAFSYTWQLYGTMRASRVIHKKLFEAVLGTTLRWLDTTPTSRVIARCTQDIQAVDGPVAQSVSLWTEVTIAMMVKFTAVTVLTPIFIIPGILVGALGWICGKFYMKAQLSVKREMSNAKAPVLGHFGAAIAGLSKTMQASIRAYGAQQAFKAESLARIDRYTKVARMFYNLNRWVGIRIDAFSAMFSASLAAYLTYGNSLASASDIGFSLNMAVGFSTMMLWWVRMMNDIEVNGMSLERIDSYIGIEQEPKPSSQGRPPAYWPASGDLRVENLSARYSQDGPRVLHNLSFHIKSGERIGVVGRTGSGKSSLTLSLLRGIHIEGEVFYDGISISTINLDALRTNATIIPQVPELLSGTLRKNLDPFEQYDDATLNDALRASGLFSIQEDSEESKLSLDSVISGGGSNLSVGQRQILALARAMIRGSKLLILDEATSAIDYRTDTIIQSSLRNKLQNDVTQIIVAHRLQTIIDADKIMVLEDGKLAEYGPPQELLANENGLFRALVDESADKEALYAMSMK
ncbi:hypothetical protein SERLADRAFT_354415 [Serpula lacrymans var. lacrymans S7.9]|uniref:ABC transporter n=1 Tax=Serpula lacrymans var. lacrymans (strain S7.9) TaxID=578457 RepID=F8NL13_SERL9|nr:uncharacterized protein SERLADRAFT_354415 [Serpula lacrymans var. lacrymans S7.9]EGO28521.1 hypothetical protein SERLADRAFT_354415 [Serpula lacrymans var. lacrymans S7.9]